MTKIRWYLPVGLEMERHAEKLIEERLKGKMTPQAGEEREKLRTKLGAAFSLPGAFKTGLAVLSPLLTGAFGGIIDLFTSAAS